MSAFVDTSALYALLNAQDPNHQAAAQAWSGLHERHETLTTSNYVLVETIALIQRRLGVQAVRDFQASFAPLFVVVWADAPLHERAMAAVLAIGSRDLSLVDCMSFEVMRETGIEAAFAFDDHFTRQGFRRIPHTEPTDETC